jgi:hypothetical protein
MANPDRFGDLCRARHSRILNQRHQVRDLCEWAAGLDNRFTRSWVPGDLTGLFGGLPFDMHPETAKPASCAK